MKTYLEAGTYNAVCDVCGVKYKAKDLLRRWDGLMVCTKDYEGRHPSDFIRVRPERPDQILGGYPPTRVFLTTYLLTEASEILLTEDGDRIEWL
jgi:hypothetical protein